MRKRVSNTKESADKREDQSRLNKGKNKNYKTKKQWEKKAGVSNPDDKFPNSPAFYFTSQELAEQASQLSFQSFLGNTQFDLFEMPTVMRVNTVMCPNTTEKIKDATAGGATFYGAVMPKNVPTGTTTPANYKVSSKSGVNFMGLKLYTTLSQFTGRTASYGPQDVTQMILGLASFAEVSEHLRRAFGIALTYNDRNRTLPIGVAQAILSDALGSRVAVDDFIRNISIYRMRFNVLMTRINQIPLLQNVAFIVKCQEFYQRVYLDDPTKMSQIWFYAPQYAYVLDETSWNLGTVLRADDITGMDVGSLLSKLESMVDALLASSTLNFIYADILNMATKLKVPTWQFDYLAENYVVMPEYNPMANLTLKNATVMGRIDTTISGFDVYTVNGIKVTNGAHIYSDVNTNEVVYNPIFAKASNEDAGWLTKSIINMPNDNPTTEERIEALRMTALASGLAVSGTSVGRASNTYWATGMALPDHYIASVRFGTNWGPSGFSNDWAMTDAASQMGRASQTNLMLVPQFESFPQTWLYSKAAGSNGRVATYSRLDYFTEVDYTYIARLLDCMSSGLFDFRVKG